MKQANPADPSPDHGEYPADVAFLAASACSLADAMTWESFWKFTAAESLRYSGTMSDARASGTTAIVVICRLSFPAFQLS